MFNIRSWLRNDVVVLGVLDIVVKIDNWFVEVSSPDLFVDGGFSGVG